MCVTGGDGDAAIDAGPCSLELQISLCELQLDLSSCFSESVAITFVIMK